MKASGSEFTSSGGKPGGHGRAGGIDSAMLSSYHQLIHDSFYGQWDQPTSLFASAHKFVCTLRVKIHPDGTIEDASIVKPSGNVIMDDSVAAATKRVKSIAPLPEPLAARGVYTININFELDQN